MSPQAVLPVAIPLAVVAVILLRNRQARPLSPGRMWIVPALVLPLIGMGLYFTPHDPFGPGAYAGFAAALALGALAGWWRGKSVDIARRDDGRLYARSSPLGLILLVGLLAARGALRLLIERQGEAWHVNAAAVTDAFMLFAVGLIVAQRLEMWLRARSLAAAPV